MQGSTAAPDDQANPLVIPGLDLHLHGWEITPIPYRRKGPPWTGTTGADGAPLSLADLGGLASEQPWNYALRLPADLVGIDVDNYDGKGGLDTWQALIADGGQRPDYTFVITSRPPAEGSGIRLYRVDTEPAVQGLGPGIEIIRHSHRYAMGPGSIHPDTGQPYRLYLETGQGWQEIDPALALLSALVPDAPTWLKAALGRRGERPAGEGIDTFPDGETCAEIERLSHPLAIAGGQPTARHDAWASAVWNVVNKAAQGHTGATAVLDRMKGEFHEAVTDRTTWGEFDRMRATAMAKATPGQEDCWGARCHRDAGLGVGPLPLPGDPGGRQGDPDSAQAGVDGVASRVRLMSTLTAKRAQWLLPGMIPAGALTILVGEEGIGKGLYGCWLAAHLTGQGKRVLLISVEDDAEVVLLPRLAAAGADLDAVAIFDVQGTTGAHRQPVFPLDLARLSQVVADGRYDLIIIDPLISVIDGRTQVKDTQQAKGVLDQVAQAASATGAAILAYVHANRLDSDDLRDKVGLSAGMRITGRSLIWCLADYDDDRTIYVGVDKSNFGQIGPAVTFHKRATPLTVGAVEVGFIPFLTPGDAQPLTIAELWAEVRARKRIDRDGRTTDKWDAVVAAADGGLITRAQIIAVYDGARKPADKAIARWTRSGRLQQTAPRSGIYEVLGA